MSTRSTSPRPAVQRPDETILIVEDDQDVRDALAEIIRGEGFQVETATSGLQALDKLGWGLRPCVILLDLQMAVMTGWDFRAEQRRDPALAAIPVIAMTAGYWKERDLSDYAARIAKPIDVKELRAKLAQYCSSESSIRSTIGAVREAEHKNLLAAIVESSEDAIISMTMDGIITSWNTSAERIFGYSSAEAVGRNISLLVPQELEEDQRRITVRVQEGQRMEHYETLRTGKNGQCIDINLTVSPVRDAAGKVAGASMILQDITERKLLEAEVKSCLRDLERSNQDLEEFSHIASHDLKEPLRGLRNLSSFLLEDYQDSLDAEGVRQLKQLVWLSERMDRLISNLLYFSKLGHEKFAIQEADPNQIVREIERMMEDSLKESNARIVILHPLPPIICDKTRITEVFRNLITNAVKYNDKAKPIVEVGFLESADAPHGHEENVFYVRDNGIGIDPKSHQTVFSMFKRLSVSEQEGKSGTGVGLTFVKKIIERHNGHIWLESELGKGSTFYFTIRNKTV